eukprot:tig00021591_g22791.t1
MPHTSGRATPRRLCLLEAVHQPRISPAGHSARRAPLLGRPLLVVVAAPTESPWQAGRTVGLFGAGVSGGERHLVPLLGQIPLLPVALRVSLG